MTQEPDGADRAGHARGPCKFTVLLPILRPPTLLPFAVRSVLAQTETDFELLILCDGAPEETYSCAVELAATDQRIRAFRFPKGERNGEQHRDTLLHGSQATFVAQIADDDLWFPDHLERLAHYLRHADFVSFRQLRVDVAGLLYTGDNGHLAATGTRERMMNEVWNFFGPSEAGYRLSAYRSLPVGWSPAPPEIFSDLFMWRKFLSRSDLRLTSRQEITGVKFPAKIWKGATIQEATEQSAAYAARLADPRDRAALRRAGMRALVATLTREDALMLLRRDPVAALPMIAVKIPAVLRKRIKGAA